MVAEVKALACELPAKLGLPLSRFSRSELRRHVLAAGIVAEISGVTIWRWLHEDALRPWSRRSWIFPRDPEFRRRGCRGTGGTEPLSSERRWDARGCGGLRLRRALGATGLRMLSPIGPVIMENRTILAYCEYVRRRATPDTQKP